MAVLPAILAAVAAQSVATVPTPLACPAPLVAPATPAPGSLSLVVATSGAQVDPRPAPCGPNGRGGDFLYRSTFSDARIVAGAPIDPAFTARLKLHTPYSSHYRLALIVERVGDGSLLVRQQAGFNGRTGTACFGELDEWPVDWWPEGPGIERQGKSLCVVDTSQIDPNAPKY